MQTGSSPDLAQRKRIPCRDGPSELPCAYVVGDAWKPSAQLDRGRELPTFVEGSADRRGVGIGDDEHHQSMGRRVSISKLIPEAPK